MLSPLPAPPSIQDDVNEDGETQHEQRDHVGLLFPELSDCACNGEPIHSGVGIEGLFWLAFFIRRIGFGSGVQGQLEEQRLFQHGFGRPLLFVRNLAFEQTASRLP